MLSRITWSQCSYLRFFFFGYLLMVNDRLNNPDKGAVTHAVVHRALWEYVSAVSTIQDETEREKLAREIFERCGFSFVFCSCFLSDTF